MYLKNCDLAIWTQECKVDRRTDKLMIDSKKDYKSIGTIKYGPIWSPSGCCVHSQKLKWYRAEKIFERTLYAYKMQTNLPLTDIFSFSSAQNNGVYALRKCTYDGWMRNLQFYNWSQLSSSSSASAFCRPANIVWHCSICQTSRKKN